MLEFKHNIKNWEIWFFLDAAYNDEKYFFLKNHIFWIFDFLLNSDLSKDQSLWEEKMLYESSPRKRG